MWAARPTVMHSLPMAGALPRPATASLSSDPYRLLFPLGVLLTWAGVGQWLFFSLGWTAQFRVVFHAMVQIQGFLGCFVAGFLLTFIPRRTMTAQPATWQVLWAAANPVLLTVFAWQEKWAWAQVFWLLQLGLLAQFAVSRLRKANATRPLLPSLVWLPASFLIGLGGALLTPFAQWHDVGRALVLEGFVTALVIGIGAMLLPVITRAEGPSLASPRSAYVFQVAAVLLFIASFFFSSSPRGAYAARLGVVCAVLVVGAKLWTWPTEPGLNRKVSWLAGWCVVLAYGLLTLWPEQRSIGLHVLFIGGFGLLALAVGHHVLKALSGDGAWLRSAARGTWGLLLCFAVSLSARVAMQLDATHYLGWMTAAATAFLAGGVFWLLEAFTRRTRL